MGKLLTGGAELTLDSAVEAYFAEHPGAEELAQFLAVESRKVFGNAVKLRVEIYRDHESSDLTPHIMVDMGMDYFATSQMIHRLYEGLDAAGAWPDVEDFVAMMPDESAELP